jgi:hypothetical protein
LSCNKKQEMELKSTNTDSPNKKIESLFYYDPQFPKGEKDGREFEDITKYSKFNESKGEFFLSFKSSGSILNEFYSPIILGSSKNVYVEVNLLDTLTQYDGQNAYGIEKDVEKHEVTHYGIELVNCSKTKTQFKIPKEVWENRQNLKTIICHTIVSSPTDIGTDEYHIKPTIDKPSEQLETYNWTKVKLIKIIFWDDVKKKIVFEFKLK